MKEKMKNYLVTIILNNKKQEIQVEAKNKKEAKEMVVNVITKCDLFGVKNIKSVKLKCKRIRREK